MAIREELMAISPTKQPQITALAEELFERLRELSFDGVGIPHASYDALET